MWLGLSERCHILSCTFTKPLKPFYTLKIHSEGGKTFMIYVAYIFAIVLTRLHRIFKKIHCLFFFLSFFPLATSPNASSELEQARPQTSGEEELQLQLALAMSREAAEQVWYIVISPTSLHVHYSNPQIFLSHYSDFHSVK